ncbi:MAG: hypothetical protein NTV06_06140 [candidate division Zixibacteria bacterium]|nr:hypothetical protein [candidate division Zixibacteria bacterium]
MMGSKSKSFFEDKGTGSHARPGEPIIITYHFDRYEIKVQLGSANEFLGIIEVKVNKEFLDYMQKISRKGFHDVEEFYKD